MRTTGRFGWVVANVLLSATVGCSVPLNPAGDDLPDASGDGFKDIVAPAGIAFEAATNVRLRLISEISQEDFVRVARARNIPEEYIAMLPLISVVVRADLTFDYPGGVRSEFGESLRLEPFERSFEFACPESVELALQVDAYLPVGGVQPLFVDAFTLNPPDDYVCGATLGYRAFVDDNGGVHVEPVEMSTALNP